VAIAPHDGLFSAHGMILKAKPNVILPDYLPFLMISDYFMNRAVEISVGSLSPTVNWSTLRQEKFSIPPLDHQRRISDILWRVDEVLLSLEGLKEKLNQILLITRNTFFTTHSKASTKRVDELFEVQLGKMLSPKAHTGTNPLPYLTNRNVQWGRFDLTEVSEMDFSQDEYKKFHLEPNDLLVCEGGEVGRCAIWDNQIATCCFQKALHRLRSLNSEYSSELMLEFMLWGGETGMFASLTGHSTIAHLTAIKLKGMKVPIIGVEQRTNFLVRMSEIRSSLKAISNHISNIEKLRIVLLNRLIGEPL